MLEMIPDPFRTGDARDRTLAELTAVLDRIREELVASGVSARRSHREVGTDVTPIAVIAESLLRERTARRSLPCGEMFADPAWDILLDLFVHRAKGRVVSVSSACIAAGVPPTTALRHLAALEGRGVIHRMADPLDRRRSFVALSDTMADAIERHIKATRLNCTSCESGPAQS